MTGIDDLVTWLRVQMDDDERVARLATTGTWKLWAMEVRADIDGSSDLDTSLPVAQTYHEAGLLTFNAQHIAFWDPPRVLALIAALRAIIGSFSWEAQETRAIQALAEALYADRPGYREEWRP
jgi:hypothetical protein